jgi:hypothetical protein
MKRERYENHYRSTIPLKDVRTFESSQLTKLSRNKNKVEVSCGYCDLIFEKYACWAKRTKNHFCSHSCHNESRKIRFPKQCAQCDTVMMLTASKMKKYSTCSKDCMRKKRTDATRQNKKYTSIDYIKIANELKKNALCHSCGTDVGPWSVMGITTYLENGLAKADASQARLVCRKCHMKVSVDNAMKSTYIVDRFKYYKEKTDEQ